MEPFLGGVSVKGNTYWFGREYNKGVLVDYLICFDFTRERFGPRLSFPPCSGKADNVVLSSFGEDKLVVLVARRDTLEMEIWVTSEIEPTLVSWSKLFLTVKKREFYYCGFQSFFIEEENKVAVFVGKDKDKRRNMAYVFGVGGYLREVDLGESTHRLRLLPYGPSSVHTR